MGNVGENENRIINNNDIAKRKTDKKFIII